MKFNKFQNLYYYFDGKYDYHKEKLIIYGFDLDHTIVRPHNGRVFPKDENDWEFAMDIEFLNQFPYIFIFTNQSTLKDVSKFEHKISQIQKGLKCRINVMIATGEDYFRKPLPGMWRFIEENLGKIDKKKSFYCGDFDGSISAKGKQTDLTFAYNYGIKHFYSPTTISQYPKLVKYQPKGPELEFYKPAEFKQVVKEIYEMIDSSDKLLLFNIGLPASGKTVIREMIMKKYKGFKLINYDSQGGSAKSKLLFDEYLKNDEKLIYIDNTNVDEDERNYYIKKAKGYDVRYIYIKHSFETLQYLNKYRTFMSEGEEKLIPDLVYRSMLKRMKLPKEKMIVLDKVFFKIKSEFYY